MKIKESTKYVHTLQCNNCKKIETRETEDLVPTVVVFKEWIVQDGRNYHLCDGCIEAEERLAESM